jgi:DNA-directed RNA polymerase specialized sigma24 family protein
VGSWTHAFEQDAVSLVQKVVAGDAAAWRSLMVKIAPRLEGWARGNRLLKRCRLAGDDDARAVMVSVLERLAANDYENLKAFLAHTEPAPPEDDLVAEVIRLGKLDADDSGADGEPDADQGTALRAWLLRLVDFTSRDHVRRRLGWGSRDGAPTKRDLHTDAAPLEHSPEPSARPPMTDRLTVSKLVAEVSDHIDTFPAEMRAAVRLWLDDVDPAEIARQLDLADPAKAKALIRAGQARLRERFRGRSPVLFS